MGVNSFAGEDSYFAMTNMHMDMVRRQIVKITSGDVVTLLPARLSRRSLAFYYGKVPGFTYFSLLEYKPAVYFSF